MSVEIHSVSEPDGNNGSLQGTTVGGTKPLHRFLKGQPKVLGTIVLILGASLFIVSIAITTDTHIIYTQTAITPGLLLGLMLIICGILYILAEHNPTKKTVTLSLSLSIVSTLVACWTLLRILSDLALFHHYKEISNTDENNTNTASAWLENLELMGLALEAVFAIHNFVGTIIFIVMSVLAGVALRSTRSQAIVVMTTASTETPDE